MEAPLASSPVPHQKPASKAAIILALLSFFTCWIPGLGFLLAFVALIVSLATRKTAAAGTAAVILASISSLGSLATTIGSALKPPDGSRGRPAAAEARHQTARVEATALETATAEEPAIALTAAKLMADYENNEVSADDAYKGRLVEISGVVAQVRKDAFDEVHVDVGMGSAWEFRHVICDVTGQEVAKAATLNKGQRIVMRGRVRGMMIGMVGLAKAEIVSVGR